MKLQRISIIIINYNGQKDTVDCLESLEKIESKGFDLQVVVVDNNSTTPFTIDKNLFHTYSLETLRSEKNLGFTGGNNLGIRHAFKTHSPEYVLLLNNDTTVAPDFLQKLVNTAQRRKNVGAVCPLIYFSKGREFHSKSYEKEDLGKVVWFAGGAIDWKHMYAYHRGVDEVDRGQFLYEDVAKDREQSATRIPNIQYHTMDFATGCCVLFPTKILEEVGLFDDAYFLYWEDVDLSWRIRQAGYEIYLEPTAHIWHKNAGSSGGSGSSLHQKYQEKNRIRFTRKHSSFLKIMSLTLRDFVGAA